jgi:hypothetical protein
MTHEKEAPVGYRRPPRHTQFKPGQSGNPKGQSRKSGKARGGEIVNGGVDAAKIQLMGSFEIMLRKLVQRALRDNDFVAVKEILSLCEKYKVIKPPGRPSG